MNGIPNGLAAALALALAPAAPAAAWAQTALDRRDDALSGHPVEEQQDLLGSDNPHFLDDPGGIADTGDRDAVPELDPLRDLDDPPSAGIGRENRRAPVILDEEDRGGRLPGD